jgi:hypothetical protein
MSEIDWWGCSWILGGVRFSDERIEVGDEGTETLEVREDTDCQLQIRTTGNAISLPVKVAGFLMTWSGLVCPRTPST